MRMQFLVICSLTKTSCGNFNNSFHLLRYLRIFEIIQALVMAPNINTITYLTVLIYTIAFFALTSIAIWDVTNIISDYTDDNRFTSVKPLNITDRFPFLSTLRICLNYDYQLFANLQNRKLNKTLFITLRSHRAVFKAVTKL